jgi:hypothetical protein
MEMTLTGLWLIQYSIQVLIGAALSSASGEPQKYSIVDRAWTLHLGGKLLLFFIKFPRGEC